jgi:hypothetical protein
MRRILLPGIILAFSVRAICQSPALAGNIAAPPVKAQEPQEFKRVSNNPNHLPPLAKPIEIVGEVVDSWCYSSQTMGEGRGERHKACGLACAYGGVTLGIVDDQGTLYIAAKHKGYTGCKELLTPFMAKRVKVKGWLGTKGGCKILKIVSVEEVKSGPQAGASYNDPHK